MIAFLDANALIYLIEGNEPFSGRVRQQIAAATAGYPKIGTALNRPSWLECRVGPMKRGDATVLAAFNSFFDRPHLRWIELDRTVVELATAVQARHGLRAPGALQAASCLQLGERHVMLTGDPVFKRMAGLNVAVL